MNKDVYEKAVKAVECEYINAVAFPLISFCFSVSVAAIVLLSIAFLDLSTDGVTGMVMFGFCVWLFCGALFACTFSDGKGYIIKYHMNREALIDEEVRRLER